MHKLPKLPYSYDALEPYIDAKTMKIHYTKHHKSYVDKLNKTLEKYPALAEKNLADLLKNLEILEVEELDRISIKNNGGGHFNHTLFWELMNPEKKIDNSLAEDIKKTFGSIDEFKKQFEEAATSRFGSGWAWLAKKPNGKLKIYSTPNQDSPIIIGDTPIIALDVWEHAYYLKYQNRRPEYINAWWKVLKLI